MRSWCRLLLLAALAASLAGCPSSVPSASPLAPSLRPAPAAVETPPTPSASRPAPSEAPPPSGAPPPSPPAAEVLVGAGDVARCDSGGDEATAELLDVIPGTVFTTGDNAYERGTATEFERCYGPSWGRHRHRTRFPAPGNHDHGTPDAAGYSEYFGVAARPHGTTWYSEDLDAWHVVVLDSTCEAVGGCGPGSAQLEWLEGDLAASPARCTLAIWHHPRFSSGVHGDDARLDAVWRVLHRAGVELVLNGHDHDYERFAPQDPDGRPDDAGGIRQFVVGTGGARLRDFRAIRPNSEVRDARTHGVLRLELDRTGYRWEFVGVAGTSFGDAGRDDCH